MRYPLKHTPDDAVKAAKKEEARINRLIASRQRRITELQSEIANLRKQAFRERMKQ